MKTTHSVPNQFKKSIVFRTNEKSDEKNPPKYCTKRGKICIFLYYYYYCNCSDHTTSKLENHNKSENFPPSAGEY